MITTIRRHGRGAVEAHGEARVEDVARAVVERLRVRFSQNRDETAPWDEERERDLFLSRSRVVFGERIAETNDVTEIFEDAVGRMPREIAVDALGATDAG